MCCLELSKMTGDPQMLTVPQDHADQFCLRITTSVLTALPTFVYVSHVSSDWRLYDLLNFVLRYILRL